MEIAISTFEKAICDAVNLLSRTRIHKDAPFYLLHPQRPLEVSLKWRVEKAEDEETTQCVEVTCETWGAGSCLHLTLSRNAAGFWRILGQFCVYYSRTYPISKLQCSAIPFKDIRPMYEKNPDAARPMEYRIRSRAR